MIKCGERIKAFSCLCGVLFLEESSVSHTESIQSAERKRKSRVWVAYLNTERGEREGGSLVRMKEHSGS